MKKINILETTLRDGSYAVNFSFTDMQTTVICRELEAVGFDYIEVGHGVGLNASKMGYGEAVQGDEEYMIAAANSLKKAKFGMFCIPGIARLENIDLAAKYNMGFIRIGTNVTEVENSKKFIERAKKYGMIVCANFMKSYVLPPKEFARKVKLSEKYGADVIYLVDSAGGMFPEDIENYYRYIRDVSSIVLGFHGHDNLALAVANSLKAVELGFDFVDSSLQGLGRSAGNAVTEILVAALLKKGYPIKVDFLEVLKLGNKYINKLLISKGRMPLGVVAGFSDFHSSYMHYIKKYSEKYEIDPAILIMEISKIDKVNLNEKKLEDISYKIRECSRREYY